MPNSFVLLLRIVLYQRRMTDSLYRSIPSFLLQDLALIFTLPLETPPVTDQIVLLSDEFSKKRKDNGTLYIQSGVARDLPVRTEVRKASDVRFFTSHLSVRLVMRHGLVDRNFLKTQI